MEGKTARGASSPAKPALHIPEPLSTTKAATSSSHILLVWVFEPGKKIHKNYKLTIVIETTKPVILYRYGKAHEVKNVSVYIVIQ